MNIRNSRPERNTPDLPRQFSNLAAEISSVIPATSAGAHLHRRYHVPVGIADLVALLAGLGIEEARQ